jgi:hypothetical protein
MLDVDVDCLQHKPLQQLAPLCMLDSAMTSLWRRHMLVLSVEVPCALCIDVAQHIKRLTQGMVCLTFACMHNTTAGARGDVLVHQVQCALPVPAAGLHGT